MKRKRPLRYRIQDGIEDSFLGLLLLFGLFIEIVWGFIVLVFKFPLRSVCKAKGDHDWKFYGGGFSPFKGPKYPFVCMRCGCRSKGDFDSLAKKGFKGKARI